MSLAFGEEFAEEESNSNSNDSVGSPSHGHKRRSGRKKFRETRHPVYRGVRERNGGRWVCEVREPHKKSRIWLGTYATPEMAARAHDVAAIALRGKSATLNFPDSEWLLPRVRTCCPEEIRSAAAKAAEKFRPVDGCGRVKEERRRGRKPVSSAAGKERVSTADTSEKTDVDGEGSLPVETTSFIDEELFNMPLLLSCMAEGMMLSPPSMHENGSESEENYDMGLWTWND